MDDEIIRVGFLNPDETDEFVDRLENLGFRCVTNGEYDEIALVDQFKGFFLPCDWLDFTNSAGGVNIKRISACKIKGAEVDVIYLPPDWEYETSISKQILALTHNEFDERMKFLRQEEGFDCYLDTVTGKEYWAEQTKKRNLNS
ncbi:MAG: hypothetical protein JW976_00820 [Syntrophaceae bacterium]|nr:hypothetical protein [Syntrophaceae bacterium]